ncbi:hypothetical protein PILCRDRAFT_813136 [Piloderma croceum F 1598]|uniref:Major facilitator superfamily (MFS) profile domain-containing protein n=1 Tax=Piloderma croceum (strain F 1598) TaxID=765440 RepID=A0A0C3CHF9_PILCF|nr:hypothetical protein PILCRDRAFT_813136 [Piloderma croceum F 1598]
MGSITPRASGFWADPVRTSYFPDDASEGEGDEGTEQQQMIDNEYDAMMEEDDRTPLDKTIDRIGMGSYQWTLLSLCGFGWMADNMWIQAVAIILPRVQQHYAVPDSYIGTLSSSMFAGMMFGAIGWGTCSDLMGRSTAFNATLFFTSIFGLMASFATSFVSLCVLLFFLGSAVGGSMPTDGTLLLEHMPKGKQYLVTALSVFFSFGAVLSAIVAILVVPQHSCTASEATCEVETENNGWQYMLMTLGLITLSMFLARIVFFRLHESPRYLVHAGRAQEALESLQLISRFNGSELPLDLDDVDDNRPPPCDTAVPVLTNSPVDERRNLTHEASNLRNEAVFDANALNPSNEPSMTTQSSADFLQNGPNGTKNYHSTGESPNSLDSQGHTFATPISENPPTTERGLNVRPTVYTNITPDVPEFKDVPPETSPSSPYPPPSARSHVRPRSYSNTSGRHRRRGSASSRRGSLYEVQQKVGGILPRWIRRPLWAWLDRVSMVLSPEWIKTTLLMWTVWFAVSLAYTMFNVFLPKLLETSSGSQDGVDTPKTLEDTFWDILIFTLGGCPGPILGAYLVETPLGRRGSLAWSTFVTAIFCVVFVIVDGPLAIRASTVGISLCATTMYAVLYGWTPEIFGTKVRGTACGIASALSRIGGMIAPLLGGTLLMIDRSFPVYTSVVIFAIAGICVLMLKEDAGDGGREPGERMGMH